VTASPAQDLTPALLSAADVEAIYGLKAKYLLEEARARRIDHYRINDRLIRFTADDIKRYLSRNRRTAS
jgi:hypothetical protein